MKLVGMLWLAALVLMAGCQGGEKIPGETRQQKEVDTMADEISAMELKSTAFRNEDVIPRKYTREGEGISPPLTWSGAPEGTQEFVLICDDPDAPRPEPWVHWIVYHIPAESTRLTEGGGGTFTEGLNSWKESGYGGPLPPKGHGPHHYHFKIYALDTDVDIGPGATKDEVLEAMEGHVVARGELIGIYER
jgi:Raf kinase inhibitor-like YbhB/YbcL family protein